MIFGFIFSFVEDLGSWLTSLLPTVGCSEVASFDGLETGFFGSYINLTLMATVFGVMVGYELAVFGFRLAVGIYRLLPLVGG